MGSRWKRPADWPQNAVALLHVDDRAIFVTVHAARRWAERVRGDPRRKLWELTPDLLRIANACAEWSVKPPSWWVPGIVEPAAPDGWLTFGPDITMPCRDGMAITTITRGSMSSEVRERRREKRRALKAAKHAISKSNSNGVTRKFDDKYRHPKRKRPAGNAVTMPGVPETGGRDGRA